MLRTPRLLGARRPRPLIAAALFLLMGPALPPSVGRAASIEPDGRLLVDGRRLFPIGLVELGANDYVDWKERIRDSGANLIWDVEYAYADTVPTCDQVLEAAREGDFFLMLGAGDTWNWDDPTTPELEVDQRMYEPDELADLIDCVSVDPERVVAWANRDEPIWTVSRLQIGDIDEAHIRDTYDQLHATLPSPLVTMNFAPAHVSRDLATWKADVRSYTTATDVVMFAAYPYPHGPGTCGEFNVIGYPDCAMDRLVIGQDIFLSELNQPGQPLWMIIQGFKNIPRKDARWQAYASIVHGATGLLWGGWNWTHWLGNGETTWPVTREVMAEVSALHEFLVGNDVPGAHANHPDVDVRALESGEQVIVIAISRGGYSGSATIQLPGVGRRPVRVLNEDRTLATSHGTIVDTFDGYEAHVYQYSLLRENPFPRPTAAATDAADGEAARIVLDAAPDPGPGRAAIRFDLTRPATALFAVHDVSGRQVAVIGRGTYAAGSGEVHWNGRDLSGRPVAAGVYFVRGRTSGGASASVRVQIHR